MQMLLDRTYFDIAMDSEEAEFSPLPRRDSTHRPASPPPVGAPVYFLHIEKTAGVSVHKVLTEQFAADDICPARLDVDIAGADADKLARYRLFSGHFTGAFADFRGAGLRTVTLLRDPIQRSISHYAHIRRDPSAEHHLLAQSLSLGEFCLHPLTRPLIEEYQTRFIAGEVLNAPVRRTAPAALPHTDGDRRRLLAGARARMADCTAVGATEHLATTLALFCKVLEFPWSGTAPYENPSYNRPGDIDRATLSTIRNLTRCDAILYREAVDRLFAQAYEAGLISERGHRPCRLKDRVRSARCTWPETQHRIKLRLSETIRKLPRASRIALAFPYAMYRLLLDASIPVARRLPLLLGVLYLAVPFDLLNAIKPTPGYPDKAAALAVGFLLSAALSGRKKLQDLKFAAIARFDL